MNILLLMMGGCGTRLGSPIPKQYIKVGNKPIFWYILKKYLQIKEISFIYIISHTDWIDYVKNEIKGISDCCEIQIVKGGLTRSESIYNGLKAIKKAEPEDVVLIHDATHPYVDKEGILKVIEKAREYGGATLASYQYDTCYQIDSDQVLSQVIPRDKIVVGASPEAFCFGKISEIYFNASKSELDQMTSAGAIALEHNIKIKVISTKILNLKITHPEDLELFQLLIDTYFFTDIKGDNLL